MGETRVLQKSGGIYREAEVIFPPHTMPEFRFKTPLTEEDVRKLRIGDSVLLDGMEEGF